MQSTPFTDFINIHQLKTVSAGSSSTVFSFTIPHSTVGFLKRLASNWFADTKLTFLIDGEEVYRSTERQLGAMEDPTVFDPPYLVQTKIEVVAENNSSEDLEFEVLADGMLYMRRS